MKRQGFLFSLELHMVYVHACMYMYKCKYKESQNVTYHTPSDDRRPDHRGGHEEGRLMSPMMISGQ